jgi:hypothetical protein
MIRLCPSERPASGRRRPRCCRAPGASYGRRTARTVRRLLQRGGRTIIGEPHVDHASGFTGNRGPGGRSTPPDLCSCAKGGVVVTARALSDWTISGHAGRGSAHARLSRTKRKRSPRRASDMVHRSSKGGTRDGLFETPALLCEEATWTMSKTLAGDDCGPGPARRVDRLSKEPGAIHLVRGATT